MLEIGMPQTKLSEHVVSADVLGLEFSPGENL
jgi:hypothetical protein